VLHSHPLKDVLASYFCCLHTGLCQIQCVSKSLKKLNQRNPIKKDFYVTIILLDELLPLALYCGPTLPSWVTITMPRWVLEDLIYQWDLTLVLLLTIFRYQVVAYRTDQKKFLINFVSHSLSFDFLVRKFPERSDLKFRSRILKTPLSSGGYRLEVKNKSPWFCRCESPLRFSVIRVSSPLSPIVLF